MTTMPTPGRFERRVAERLADRTAAVIASRDSGRAAALAIAIARVQGTRRRVAIADLVGEQPALEALVPAGDDVHGIADSFLYGVSLNRIARPVGDTGNVFVMPSGSEPVAIPGVYGNDRWRRLAAGFAQVGALLLVVARPDIEGFDALCRHVGAVIVLDDTVPVVPDVPCLDLSQTPAAGVPVVPEGPARARSATSAGVGGAGRPSGAVTTPTVGTLVEPSDDDAMRRTAERQAARARGSADLDAAARRSRLFAMLAVVAAVIMLALVFWPRVQAWLGGGEGAPASEASAATAAGPDADRRADAAPSPPTADPAATTAASAAAAAGAIDSAGDASDGTTGGASAPRPAAAAPAGVPPVIANPADSARASAWAFFLVAADADTTARNSVDARVARIAPVAPTALPFGPAGRRWYRVIVGASRDSLEAAAVVQRLRDAAVIGSETGSILRAPYAFRLAEGVATANVDERIAAWRRRGIDAYALQQDDGRITLYTGAYETPAQAALTADSLRGLGVPPTFVFRTGRSL